MKSVLPDAVDVGSPFIVLDPDTYQPYMLFTAWSDPNGIARHVWVAEIDEDLSVRNIRRIASPAIFNVSGLNTATAFWDDYNEEWVFACTAYGAPKASYSYFIFFDREWNIRRTQVVDLEQVGEGYTWTPGLSDAGIGMVPHFDKSLTLSAGGDRDRALFYIENYTERPLPKPRRDLVGVLQAPTYLGHARDVHQLFVYNSWLVMLSEKISGTELWNLEVCFGPEKDWHKAGNTFMVDKWHFVCPITWSHGKINYSHIVPNQLQHPHYTTHLGRPLLFYMTSPTWIAGGKRAWSHEIWAEEIDPEEAFNPVKNMPLIASGHNEPYKVGKVSIPTFGAKSAEIILFGVKAQGKLTVVESTNPYHIWVEDSIRHTTEYTINTGSNKIILENPAPYIALKTTVDLEEWIVILR